MKRKSATLTEEHPRLRISSPNYDVHSHCVVFWGGEVGGGLILCKWSKKCVVCVLFFLQWHSQILGMCAGPGAGLGRSRAHGFGSG